MGKLFVDPSIKIKKITLYDIVVFLYVVALYVFENATYSNLFTFLQMIFFYFTAIELFYKKRILILYTHIWSICLIAFISITSFFFVQIDNSQTIIIMIKNILRCVCFLIYLSNENRLEKVIKYIALAGLICSFFLFSDYISSDVIFGDLRYASFDRVGAEIAGGNVNIVAMNMCFSFTAWLYLSQTTKIKWRKVFCIICTIIVVILSFLTGARKTLLYYLVVYMLYNIFFYQGKKKKIFISIIALLVVYYCLINVEPLYYFIGHKIDFFSDNTFYQMYDYSDEIRSNLSENGLKLFLEHPIIGVGFGNTAHYLGTYAHNNYIEILASGGILGFIIYYSIYLLIGFKSIRNRNVNNHMFYIFSSFIGLCVLEFSQVTYLYGVPWLFIAIATSYCEKKKKHDN